MRSILITDIVNELKLKHSNQFFLSIVSKKDLRQMVLLHGAPFSLYLFIGSKAFAYQSERERESVTYNLIMRITLASIKLTYEKNFKRKS